MAASAKRSRRTQQTPEEKTATLAAMQCRRAEESGEQRRTSGQRAAVTVMQSWRWELVSEPRDIRRGRADANSARTVPVKRLSLRVKATRDWLRFRPDLFRVSCLCSVQSSRKKT